MRPQRAVGEYALPSSLAGWFTVTEVDDVEAHAGDLFRRAFRAPPPPTPHHYVARVEMNGKPRTIGYVHYERVGDVYLCGGMCMDERTFRRLDGGRRSALRLRAAFTSRCCAIRSLISRMRRPSSATWGDRRAERVDLRVGFRHTGLPHLIVHCPRRLPATERQALIERIASLGPF